MKNIILLLLISIICSYSTKARDLKDIRKEIDSLITTIDNKLKNNSTAKELKDDRVKLKKLQKEYSKKYWSLDENKRNKIKVNCNYMYCPYEIGCLVGGGDNESFLSRYYVEAYRFAKAVKKRKIGYMTNMVGRGSWADINIDDLMIAYEKVGEPGTDLIRAKLKKALKIINSKRDPDYLDPVKMLEDPNGARKFKRLVKEKKLFIEDYGVTHSAEKRTQVKTALCEMGKRLKRRGGGVVTLNIGDHGATPDWPNEPSSAGIYLFGQILSISKLQKYIKECIIDQVGEGNVKVLLTGYHCFSGAAHQISKNLVGVCSAFSTTYDVPNYSHPFENKFIKGIIKALDKDPNADISLQDAFLKGMESDTHFRNGARASTSSMDYLATLLRQSPHDMRKARVDRMYNYMTTDLKIKLRELNNPSCVKFDPGPVEDCQKITKVQEKKRCIECQQIRKDLDYMDTFKTKIKRHFTTLQYDLKKDTCIQDCVNYIPIPNKLTEFLKELENIRKEKFVTIEAFPEYDWKYKNLSGKKLEEKLNDLPPEFAGWSSMIKKAFQRLNPPSIEFKKSFDTVKVIKDKTNQILNNINKSSLSDEDKKLHKIGVLKTVKRALVCLKKGKNCYSLQKILKKIKIKLTKADIKKIGLDLLKFKKIKKIANLLYDVDQFKFLGQKGKLRDSYKKYPYSVKLEEAKRKFKDMIECEQTPLLPSP